MVKFLAGRERKQNHVQSFDLFQTLDNIWENFIRSKWLQWIVVLSVLMVTSLVAARASVSFSLSILILLLGLAAVLVLLRWPNLGLLGALLGAAFVPFTGPGGLNVAVVAIAGLVGLWFLDMVARQRQIRFVDRQTTIPLMVFIVSALLSFGVGQLPWYPLARHAPFMAQFGGLLIYVLSALAFLMVSNTIRDLRWLQAFTWLLVAIGAIFILSRIVPGLDSLVGRHYQHGVSNSSLFWVWIVMIPFSQALLNNRLRMRWRAALMVLVVLTLYVAVIRSSDWKSGYLPTLAGMAVILALLLRRHVIWFIPVGLFLAWNMSTEAVATDQYSYITRMDAWKIVIELSAVSPIFGIGFSNYYWYTHLFPILGWQVAFNSHSQYIDIVSQTGILGLITFAWFFWEVGRLGLHLHNRVPAGFARAYVYGALGGLVGTLVAGGLGDWVLPFVYNVGMNGFRSSMLSWLFLGGLVALAQMYPVHENIKASDL